jgi:hypothetical protein
MIGIGWATLYHSMIEKYNKQQNSQEQINNNIQQNNVNM